MSLGLRWCLWLVHRGMSSCFEESYQYRRICPSDHSAICWWPADSRLIPWIYSQYLSFLIYFMNFVRCNEVLLVHRWNFPPILVFLKSFRIRHVCIPCLLEKLYGTFISFFDFCDYFVFVIFGVRKLLNHCEDLTTYTFSTMWFLCYHNVDFAFVGFYPLGKEQIDISNHLIVVKYDKGVLGWVLQPGFLVVQLLLKSQRLTASQFKQFGILHPLVVLLYVLFTIWVQLNLSRLNFIMFFHFDDLNVELETRKSSEESLEKEWEFDEALKFRRRGT